MEPSAPLYTLCEVKNKIQHQYIKMETRAPPASRYKEAGRRPEGGTGIRASQTKQNKIQSVKTKQNRPARGVNTNSHRYRNQAGGQREGRGYVPVKQNKINRTGARTPTRTGTRISVKTV